jgi:hypothetical protein
MMMPSAVVLDQDEGICTKAVAGLTLLVAPTAAYRSHSLHKGISGEIYQQQQVNQR